MVRISYEYGRSRGDTEAIGDKTPDECWYAGGLFYFNREDPAILVEKRFGFGYTLNMARAESWMMMGVFLALPLFLIILT
jgi:uncharacterized membrane protein